jgi:hypothetical protein
MLVKRAIAYALALTLTCEPVVAQQQGQCFYTSAVVFGNGILTTRNDAARSLQVMIDRLSDYFAPYELQSIDQEIAYNTTGGALADLIESIAQEQQTNPGITWLLFWLAVFGVGDVFLLALVVDLYLTSIGTITELQDLSEQLDLYRGITDAGGRVILVAHSQGTLFANLSYDQLTPDEQQHMKVYGAAVVASRIPGGAYTTLQTDLVVAGVTTAEFLVGLPIPLPPNTVNSADAPDTLGHNFVTSYLNGDHSGPAIMDFVADQIRSGPAACRG